VINLLSWQLEQLVCEDRFLAAMKR